MLNQRCKTIRARRSAVGIGLTILVMSTGYSATVVPSERVVNFVTVREAASSDSASVGRLHPGEQATLVATLPNWHKVVLADQTPGYVSKSWTTVIPDGPAEPVFQIHFLDVGTGDAAIIDVGDQEIVIDGGESTRILHDYAKRTGIITDPIELVVVTHGDSDHWKGLPRLLGFDGQATTSYRASEFWEPGYNRDCNALASYTTFISNVNGIPGVRFLRPLESSHTPAVTTGQAQPFSLPSIPGVRFTVLHSDSTPTSVNNDCPYLINNASIVLMIELSGFRFLFTGDANGKERGGPDTPGHVEAELLQLEAAHPGTLKADLLKVPHHGSETASTQAFINAVDPAFAIISASTRHHLPRETVVARYANGRRVLFRTDENEEADRDHIICFKDPDGSLDCNCERVLSE